VGSSKKSDAGEEAEIQAAGGVVVRERDGVKQIAVIHRPQHSDWSLPKGKLDKGETFEEAAVREVEEETGLRCELGRELRPVTYDDRRGRSKVVRYWLMKPLETAKAKFKPNSEVDELRWLELDDAIELLDYDHDRELVRDALVRRWRFRRPT
jgi:8-oxo-dGTP diphosphatase